MSLEKNTKKHISRLRVGRQVRFIDAGHRIVAVMNSITKRGVTIYGMKDIDTGRLEVCSHSALTKRINEQTAVFVNPNKNSTLAIK